jgi:hypothetical protein
LHLAILGNAQELQELQVQKFHALSLNPTMVALFRQVAPMLLGEQRHLQHILQQEQ